MKLSAFNSDTQYFVDPTYGIKLVVREVSEDACKLELIMEGVVQELITSNPLVAGFATYWAVDAYRKSQKKKRRNTTTIYAKNPIDKKLYQRIVDDLLKTGHYKLVKSHYSEGGFEWVLTLINKT